MRVLITGATGLVGRALQDKLTSENIEAVGVKRNSAIPPCWSIEKKTINLGTEKFDAIVHLAGENIAGRWTDQKKRAIYDSRIGGTKLLCQHLKQLDHKPELLISGSAVGFYGDCGDKILDEQSNNGNGFLANVCNDWEAATIEAENAGIRTIHLRTGIVLSTTGGALTNMLMPFKLGIGGKLGNGQQYMSWIHLDDMVNAILYLLKNSNIAGPVNMTAPHSTTNMKFTKSLGKTLSRPTFASIPKFAIKGLLGEMGDQLLLSSTNTIPSVLLDHGFDFRHSDIEKALDDLL